MVKFTVLLGAPDNPEAFEKYYLDVHVPLVKKMPGLLRFEASRLLPGRDGRPPAHYRMAELYFEDMEHLTASFASPEGRAGGEDTAKFPKEVVLTSMISELD